MISYEKRNGMKLSLIYKNQRKIAGIKEDNNTRIGKETPAPRNMSNLIEHLINNMKHSASGRANPRSSEAT